MFMTGWGLTLLENLLSASSTADSTHLISDILPRNLQSSHWYVHFKDVDASVHGAEIMTCLKATEPTWARLCTTWWGTKSSERRALPSRSKHSLVAFLLHVLRQRHREGLNSEWWLTAGTSAPVEESWKHVTLWIHTVWVATHMSHPPLSTA